MMPNPLRSDIMTQGDSGYGTTASFGDESRGTQGVRVLPAAKANEQRAYLGQLAESLYSAEDEQAQHAGGADQSAGRADQQQRLSEDRRSSAQRSVDPDNIKGWATRLSHSERRLVSILPATESFIAWPPRGLTDRDADGIASAFHHYVEGISRSLLGRRLF
jgi:hypothetical protein